MSKLDYKGTTIINSVIPQIESGINNLNQALNYYSSLNIPNSFSYKNSLLQIHSELSSLKNTLSSNEEWISKSAYKLNQLEEELAQGANLLPKYDLKVRNTTL